MHRRRVTHAAVVSPTTTSATTTTRSNLGPLLTTWVPAPQCTVFGPGGNNVSAANFYLAQDCLSGAPHDWTSCWPPATRTVAFPSILNGYGYYSPGLVCPSGYTSACAQGPSKSKLPASISSLKAFSFQFPPIDDETAVGCCPTGMACDKPFSGFQSCISTSASRGDAIDIGLCGTSTTYTETSKLSIGKSVPALYGPLIQLVYQATDISSASITSTGTTTTSPGSAPASTASSSPDTSGDSDGLTNGAKIGIGVGVPLGVLLLAALAFLFFRFRRRQSTPTAIDMAYTGPSEAGNKTTSGDQYAQYPKDSLKPEQNAELDGMPARTVHELSAEPSPR